MSSVNNKHVYVGSTKNFKRRCRRHMNLCKRGKHQHKVQALYNSTGPEFFEFDVLSEHTTKAEALEYEQAWVDYYKAHPTVWNLMNIATENVNCSMQNPEVAAKMAAAQMGKKHSSETKAKMSAAQMGRQFSDDHRANISAAQRGRKLSAAHKAKLASASSKPVYVKWANGTEMTFLSRNAAGEHIGVSGSTVGRWIEGKFTTHYKRGIDEIRYA
jgi:group I intron endonuclease